MGVEKHVFKRILHSPTSTNHNLNVRSPLGNDERSFAVREAVGRVTSECDVWPGFQSDNSAGGIPLYALSNWSAETSPISLRRFEFLRWFHGILLSGEVRLLKPDPRIFQLHLDNHAVDPAHTVYIDDLKPNVEAAVDLGMHGILFTDPIALRHELVKVGLIPA